MLNSLSTQEISFWEKAFVLWIPAYQITSAYAFPQVPYFTVGDIGLFIIILVLSTKMLVSRRRVKVFAPALLMLLISIPWLMSSLVGGFDTFMRMLRFMFSIFVVAFFVPNFFHKELVIPIIRTIAVVSSFFVIGQFLFVNIFGIYLSGKVPYFVSSPSAEVILDTQGNIVEIRRFFAFFDEPASLSTFLAIALVCGISEDKQKLKRFIPELLMVIGIFISQATTGFGLLVIIFGFWLMYSSCKKGILLITTISIVVLVEVKYGIISNILKRTVSLTDSGLKLGSAIIGRVANFSSAFNISQLTFQQLLFGRGMNRLTEFIPGWGKCFVYFGLAGLVLVILMYLYLFLSTKGYARVLTVCLIALNFFGDYLFGVTPLFVLPYIISLSSNRNSKLYFTRINKCLTKCILD